MKNNKVIKVKQTIGDQLQYSVGRFWFIFEALAMAREQKRNIAELKTEEQEQSVVYGILLIYFEEKFFIKDVCR